MSVPQRTVMLGRFIYAMPTHAREVGRSHSLKRRKQERSVLSQILTCHFLPVALTYCLESSASLLHAACMSILANCKFRAGFVEENTVL